MKPSPQASSQRPTKVVPTPTCGTSYPANCASTAAKNVQTIVAANARPRIKTKTLVPVHRLIRTPDINAKVAGTMPTQTLCPINISILAGEIRLESRATPTRVNTAKGHPNMSVTAHAPESCNGIGMVSKRGIAQRNGNIVRVAMKGEMRSPFANIRQGRNPTEMPKASSKIAISISRCQSEFIGWGCLETAQSDKMTLEVHGCRQAGVATGQHRVGMPLRSKRLSLLC